MEVSHPLWWKMVRQHLSKFSDGAKESQLASKFAGIYTRWNEKRHWDGTNIIQISYKKESTNSTTNIIQIYKKIYILLSLCYLLIPSPGRFQLNGGDISLLVRSESCRFNSGKMMKHKRTRHAAFFTVYHHYLMQIICEIFRTIGHYFYEL